MMMIGAILEGCFQHWIVMICCNALLLSYAENHDGVDVNLIALLLSVFCTQLNPFLLIWYFMGKIMRGTRPSILDCCVWVCWHLVCTESDVSKYNLNRVKTNYTQQTSNQHMWFNNCLWSLSMFKTTKGTEVFLNILVVNLYISKM